MQINRSLLIEDDTSRSTSARLAQVVSQPFFISNFSQYAMFNKKNNKIHT